MKLLKRIKSYTLTFTPFDKFWHGAQLLLNLTSVTFCILSSFARFHHYIPVLYTVIGLSVLLSAIAMLGWPDNIKLRMFKNSDNSNYGDKLLDDLLNAPQYNYYIDPDGEKMLKEASFKLFKHEGLWCCIQRMSRFGTLNGYVAVPPGHPFWGLHYHDTISLEGDVKFNGNYIGLLLAACGEEEGKYRLDMAINVHYGLTYAASDLSGIPVDFEGVSYWWFGFDTAHAGDLQPIQWGKFSHLRNLLADTYRDFEFVEAETISLASQLFEFSKSYNDNI